MDYRYGPGAEEVDEFFRVKRPWSRVKDKIVGDYVHCYLKTVPSLRQPILIVDGFAGPGRFGDGTDGSPLIICKAISERSNPGTGMRCLFSDTHPGHRAALSRNLAEFIRRGICEPAFEDCAQALTRALEVGAKSTIFFYLDPYGIKDLEFEMVKQIYARDPARSTEVLINFSFRTFMRMSGNWKYSDSASEVANKVKRSKVERVNSVMGGDYWLTIITDPALDRIGRENAVVEAYTDRVRQFFRYAYSVPVKERKEDEYRVPADDLAHYHLIFGTRSSRAVRYMNDVALNALRPYFSQFKDGLLFDVTPERYASVDRELVKKALVDAVHTTPLTRPEIYEQVIPNYFMHYWVKDYRKMVDELAFREGRLYPDPRAKRRAKQLNDETLLSAKPWEVVS